MCERFWTLPYATGFQAIETLTAIPALSTRGIVQERLAKPDSKSENARVRFCKSCSISKTGEIFSKVSVDLSCAGMIIVRSALQELVRGILMGSYLSILGRPG